MPNPDAIKSLPGVTLTAASATALVLKENPSRAHADFINGSDTDMYLWLSAQADAARGILLKANGGWYEINRSNPYFGAISVYCSAASKSLYWQESSYAG